MRVVRIKWEKEDANLALLRDVTKQRKSEEEIRKYSKNLETSNKELVKMHADVEKHRRELQRLSEKIVNVQEEERKNLSRELHDHTGQALIALKTNLEVIDKLLPEDAVKPREWLRDSKQFLIQTINEVRSLSFYLRPPMLDELGLAPTIESYAKDYANRTKIVVNVKSSFKVEGLRPEQELSLYRMVQEALTNIAKHSGAKTVQINIYKEDSKLVLSVKDDGKGFDIDDTRQDGARERGVGLLGMRERFLSTGAEFRVHSKEGEGTALIAKYQINN
jgi:signal transduction histidine kinase